MKKLKLFFALFAMLALGVGNAWAEEVYFEGFEENHRTSGSNSYTASAKTYGDWTLTYADAVTSGSPLTGTAHVIMRVAKNTTNSPSLVSKALLSDNVSVTKVSWNCKGNTAQTLKVSYSTDGSNWVEKYSASLGSKANKSFTLDNVPGPIYLKFVVSVATSTSSNRDANIDDITIEGTSSGSGNEETVVKTLQSIEVTPKTVDYETGDVFKFDGTCTATYSVTKGGIAQPDVNETVTPTSVSEPDMSTAGTKEITVTYTEDDVTVTDKYNITVIENVVTPGKYCITPNNTFWGTNYTGTNANAATTLSGKQDDISILHTKSGSNLYVNDSQTRVYANHTMKISVPLGYVITAIAFTADGNNWAGTHTADVGKMIDTKNWVGANQNVTITFGGTCRITNICVTYIKDVKYALTITEPTEGGALVVKDGENTLTSGAEIYEGTKLTVTATPETGYEDGVVVVKNASDEDITATIYADGVLTMPAYAVTISATFEKKPCELLAKPTVSATTTYSSATLTWEAVANAAKYSVKVGTADAVETTETSYVVTGLTAETEYTYQVQAIAEADQDTYCDSEVAEGTFTTATAPTATLTLSDIEGTTTKIGALNGTITLPTEAAECSKTFVGWDADKNCDHAPTYAPGAEYTFTTVDPTLYAVYADGEAGEALQWTIKNDDLKVLDSSQSSGYAKYAGDQEKDGVTFNITSVMPATGENAGKIQMQAEKATIYNKTAMPGNIISIAIDGVDLSVYEGTEVISSTPSSGAITKNSEVYNFSSGKRYFHLKKSTKSAGYANSITVTYASAPTYSNYSTTCAAAPKAEVTPTEVTATAAGGNGKVEVAYENVNTANVSVALYNDDACTEAFTADWLTASIDADKNIAYTVAENTTYAERKAYIQLTAPEANGTTEPAKVVIPVIQAGKDKVFASLEDLVAADLTAGDEVTVTLNNDVIKEFYIYNSNRAGVVFDVQKDGNDIKIYFNNQTTIVDWAVGGKLSGTLTNVKWTTYSSAWQLAPDYNTWAWENLTYTEPKAVSTVVVSGAPTKTTYVDGEAFDPAGLTVTVNYNDATTEVNPIGVTFAVTPATLVKGQTSVSVTATYNSVTSAAYEVTGLTVNDIPTKTIAEFIAAGGTRCYLEGIVSNITNTTYGNFDLTDASGTIYVYGCLNAEGVSQKFADLGVKNGDKIKVIADEYELYGGTKDEAKNVQYVSHISAASITIADITMEVKEVKTISATVEPAEAVVTYTIKENAANAISLSGNTITALAEGTATITATVAEGATYIGNSVDFTVTVTPESTSDEVVILAEYNGNWYALQAAEGTGSNSLAALEVTYFDGILYNVADKESITWTRTVVGNQVTFKNGENYLTGGTGTGLSLANASFEWTYKIEDGQDTYIYEYEDKGSIKSRTFLFHKDGYFKNYATSNAKPTQTEYSGYPVVTAPVYATAIEIGGDDNSSVIEANEGQKVNVIVDRAFEAGDEWYTLCVPFNMSASLIGTAYQLSGLIQKDADYVEVNLAAKNTIEAGKPYLVKPNVTVNKFVVENVTIVNTTGESIAKSIEGLSVEMQGVINGSGTTGGLYWVGNSGYLYNDDVAKLGLRTYFNITTSSGIAPRMRVVAGENVETGVEDLFTTDAPVKVIENGQLIIIRDGVKYNVQGQKL